MSKLHKQTEKITELILKAAEQARKHRDPDAAPPLTGRVKWPVECTIGPGLEGAIAGETKISYVNGGEGALTYQGFDIYDLCAHSTYEEVSYLLLHGKLPTKAQLASFTERLVAYRKIPSALRLLMNFPLKEMHPMAGLRLGTNMMRHRLTWRDLDIARPAPDDAIAADEDSIPMETAPMGERRAIYEFRKRRRQRPGDVERTADDATSVDSCLHLIAGMASIAAAISRLRNDKMPLEPDPELSHAGNFIYMLTGERPEPEQERLMDVALILHADHGMNASTFAAMVVASTLSDIYFSVGSGIAALSGPLHGGANEQVLRTLEEIGSPDAVPDWYRRARKHKKLIPGFGHRVYKTYDPRAQILEPLAKRVSRRNKKVLPLLRTADQLEKAVVADLGKKRGIYPNVDYFSGLVYLSVGAAPEMFTPIFAVSRVAGWTAHVLEYLRNNRIFRPRSIYIGDFGRKYVPISRRKG